MHRLGAATALLLAHSALGCGSDERLLPLEPPVKVELVGAVDPMIGTGGLGFGVGSAYPGPALPFALIHPGPDTTEPGGAPGFYHCSGYYYDDPLIEGFSLLRMHGTGVPDYGTLALMPVDGMKDAYRGEDGYRAGFDHADEHAEPGYYRVTLDSGIVVEITSTLRAAQFRFTFPSGVAPTVLLDGEHVIGDEAKSGGGEVAVDAAGDAPTLDVRMRNLGDFSSRFGGFDVFARLVFDTPAEEVGVWDDEGLRGGELQASGTDIGAWLRFAPATTSADGTTRVQARLGVSLVDADGAQANLAAEIPEHDFDAVRGAAEQRWATDLGQLEVWGANERETTAVATALYHTRLMPTLMSDVDARVLDVQGNAIVSEHPRYSDFSLWDTYRTLHPWLLLAEDPVNRDFAASLLAMAEEGGAVPRWALAHSDVRSMIGSPGEIVLAEMAVKGVVFEDESRAYDLARVAAFGPAPGAVGGRSAAADYLAHGYVPSDLHGGSVSRTQEYAIADAALADWARRLGRDDDAQVLQERAGWYRKLYDDEVGFFRGLRSDGSWETWRGELGQDPMFIEGDAWQYLWLAPHDADGLAETLGGRARAVQRLSEFFENSAIEEPVLGFRSYYWHGNEPDLHAPWLFAMWGERDRTVRWVRWVAETFYGTGPDGIAGNDDGGTLSAWMLFASLGIYPIAGLDRYVVGAPLFPRVVLHRASGDLVVEAEPHPRAHPHVVAITLDGEPVEGPYLRHEQLVGSHRLHFTMGR
jgi:predicted alpha-1,2-mannosidase